MAISQMKSPDGKAQSLRLTDLAAYQEGTVVSREIIRKDVGTVTVFAFDQGQGLSEHTAPFDAMIIVLDGSAQVTIEQTTHEVGSGYMIILPAHKPHAVKALTPFKMLLVMIRA